MIGNQFGQAYVSDSIRSCSKPFYSLQGAIKVYAIKVYLLKQQCMFGLPLVNQFCYMAVKLCILIKPIKI